MKSDNNILVDSFGRKHTYLRISLTERCNLRCTYCMPAEGVPLTPKPHLMSADEIYTIAKNFVSHGVTKIRLTGGEPLVRKDAGAIIEKLASLGTTLSITTNGIIVDRFISLFKKVGLETINVSLDSLNSDKFKQITRRDYFDKVYKNILLLVKEQFQVKVNVVLVKGFNDNEITDFITLTKDLPIHIRFIEFMPFDGNAWNMDKLVSLQSILKTTTKYFGKEKVQRIKDAPNDTAKNYKIEQHKGTFAVISSVTNPFCDSCNRIRLTANGQLKNCLFSLGETDLLTPLRNNIPIAPIIAKTMCNKFKVRGGMDSIEKLKNPNLHGKNRSMTAIGG